MYNFKRQGDGGDSERVKEWVQNVPISKFMCSEEIVTGDDTLWTWRECLMIYDLTWR